MTITAYNLQIQFDHPEGYAATPLLVLEKALDAFTLTLQSAYPDMKPQIRTDESDFRPDADLLTDDD